MALEGMKSLDTEGVERCTALGWMEIKLWSRADLGADTASLHTSQSRARRGDKTSRLLLVS